MCYLNFAPEPPPARQPAAAAAAKAAALPPLPAAPEAPTPPPLTGREHPFSDEFMMMCFKVVECGNPAHTCDDWDACPFTHPGEAVTRRPPNAHLPRLCPKARRACRKGASCVWAHNVFEAWLHPSTFKTELCKNGAACSRHMCFFAHDPAEIRRPSPTADDILAAAAAAGLVGKLPASAGGAPAGAALAAPGAPVARCGSSGSSASSAGSGLRAGCALASSGFGASPAPLSDASRRSSLGSADMYAAVAAAGRMPALPAHSHAPRPGSVPSWFEPAFAHAPPSGAPAALQPGAAVAHQAALYDALDAELALAQADMALAHALAQQQNARAAAAAAASAAAAGPATWPAGEWALLPGGAQLCGGVHMPALGNLGLSLAPVPAPPHMMTAAPGLFAGHPPHGAPLALRGAQPPPTPQWALARDPQLAVPPPAAGAPLMRFAPPGPGAGGAACGAPTTFLAAYQAQRAGFANAAAAFY